MTLLALATAIECGVCGFALAYLVWANQKSKSGPRVWGVWGGAIASVVAWAWLAGRMLETSGASDASILASLSVGAVCLAMAYVCTRARLNRSS